MSRRRPHAGYRELLSWRDRVQVADLEFSTAIAAIHPVVRGSGGTTSAAAACCAAAIEK